LKKIIIRPNKNNNKIIIMEEFPSDFNVRTLQSKIPGTEASHLAQYRKKIYKQFQHATENGFSIELDSNFTPYVQNQLANELQQRGMSMIISPWKRIDNVIFYSNRYLIIKPLITKKSN
jgi:hypothetical protein